MFKKVLRLIIFTSLFCLFIAFSVLASTLDNIVVYDGYPGHIGKKLNVFNATFTTNYEPHSLQYYETEDKKSAKSIRDSFVYIEYKDNPAASAWYYMTNLNTKWIQFNGNWYYANVKRVLNGLVGIDGSYYYFDPQEYTMCTSGEVMVYGKKYIICSDGICRPESELGYASGLSGNNTATTGWDKENGQWIFLRNGSKVKSEWIQDNGLWYYLDENGFMLSDTARSIDGTLYYFNSSGVMAANGSIVINGKKYQAAASGALTLVDDFSDPSATILLAINEVRQKGGQPAFVHDDRLDTLAKQTKELIDQNKRVTGSNQISISNVYLLAVLQGINVSHIGYIDCISYQGSLDLSYEAKQALQNPMFTHVGFCNYAEGLKTTIVFASY